MCHFQASPLEPTLDIEPLFRLRAVQDSLIAARILRHKVQRLNDTQPQLLPLLILRDSNVLYVTDLAELVYTRMI